MKIAAVQLNATFADVKANLLKSEKYISQAKSEYAEIVLLPEFFTSAIGFSEKMLNVASENKKVQNILLQWAKKYHIIIGGSYISFDGKNAYNLFALVFPNGEIFMHKKDIPTQFENCYYTNGDENNILVTPIGKIGVALCWEMIRYDTIKRMYGKVDIVLAGSCWWDLPNDAPIDKEPLRKYNQNLAQETPVTFAKLLGVPLVHASHCGEIIDTGINGNDSVKTRKLVGAAQIINKNGDVISKRCFFDGEGIIFANLSLDTAKQEDTKIFPAKYWIPDLLDQYIKAWETLNPKGKEYYNDVALPHYSTL